MFTNNVTQNVNFENINDKYTAYKSKTYHNKLKFLYKLIYVYKLICTIVY